MEGFTYKRDVVLDEIRWMIDHACRVNKLTFKIIVLLLACLAVLASISRVIFRLRQDRRLIIDDYFVLFATVCLVAATGCLYHFHTALYFVDAVSTNKTVYDWMASDPARFAGLVGVGPDWPDAYMTLAWLSIFGIKASFLTLFHRMVRNVKKSLTIYFWVTVATTSVAGVVVILSTFVLCPHFGSAASQCFMQVDYTFSLTTGIVCQLVDIVTDLMIIAIPLLLLQMSQLRFEHKLRIAIVLCLSSICIFLSVGRLSGAIQRNIRGNLQVSTVWVSFMLHCEAAVAVITGSVPALRAIYRSHQKRRTICGTAGGTGVEAGSEELSTKSRPSGFVHVLGQSSSKSPLVDEENRPPKPPPKTRHSLSNFQIPRRIGSLRRHSETTVAQPHPTPNRSASSSIILAPIEAYHEFHKQEKQRAPEPPPPRNEIRVTYECTVLSEEAELHDLPDFNQVGRQEWVCEGGSGEEERNDDRIDVLQDLDPALLGRITSGMMI